jgi:hypothetical protein
MSSPTSLQGLCCRCSVKRHLRRLSHWRPVDRLRTRQRFQRHKQGGSVLSLFVAGGHAGDLNLDVDWPAGTMRRVHIHCNGERGRALQVIVL